MFTEDLDLFIDVAEHAVPVVANGVSGSGIFDMPGELVDENGLILSSEYQVRCKASQFGGLGYNDSIVVNGQSFQVRHNRPIFDGAFCLLQLSKVDTPADSISLILAETIINAGTLITLGV